MVNRLAINGCSYMQYFSDGGGHIDLANRLGIARADNIARNGSCNDRIVRTTLKDSFSNEPTLYVMGISFLTRFELPILSGRDEFEGKWISVTTAGGTSGQYEFDTFFDDKKIKEYSHFWDRCTVLGLEDLMEDLMYRIMSMIDSLTRRGHRIVIFNTAEHTVDSYIFKLKFNLLRSLPAIIDGLQWKSISWQFDQGAAWPAIDEQYPRDCRHVRPGDHSYLNTYLVDYINKNNLL